MMDLLIYAWTDGEVYCDGSQMCGDKDQRGSV